MSKLPGFLSFLRSRITSLRKEERGLTLVEELVAVGVVGLGLVILVTMITTGAIGVRKVDEQVTGQTLARSQLELIKDADYEVDPGNYPALSPVPGYSVNVQVSTLDAGLQKVTVTVSSQGEELQQTSTYKVDR